MDEDSLVDEECLALESIFEDRFTRLQPDRVRLVILPEGAEDSPAGAVFLSQSCVLICLQSEAYFDASAAQLQMRPAGVAPLYLEFVIPASYPEVVPRPDLANLNNAPYAPAVKMQATAQLVAEVSNTPGLLFCVSVCACRPV